MVELRGELKQTRKKLHDHRESEKGEANLAKARAEVERSASQQLEVVRSELATALADVGRLRSEAEAFRTRRPAPAPRSSAGRARSGRGAAPARAPPLPRAVRHRSREDGAARAPRQPGALPRPGGLGRGAPAEGAHRDAGEGLHRHQGRAGPPQGQVQGAGEAAQPHPAGAGSAPARHPGSGEEERPRRGPDRAHRRRGRRLGPLGGGARRRGGGRDRPADPTSRAGRAHRVRLRGGHAPRPAGADARIEAAAAGAPATQHVEKAG